MEGRNGRVLLGYKRVFIVLIVEDQSTGLCTKRCFFASTKRCLSTDSFFINKFHLFFNPIFISSAINCLLLQGYISNLPFCFLFLFFFPSIVCFFFLSLNNIFLDILSKNFFYYKLLLNDILYFIFVWSIFLIILIKLFLFVSSTITLVLNC